MDANMIEAIIINTIMDRKILIRKENIAILKFLNIIYYQKDTKKSGFTHSHNGDLCAFFMFLVVRFFLSNSFIKFKSKHN